MTSKIRIFNKFGEILDTLDGVSTTRSWVLNKYGRCEFAIPYKLTDPETGQEFDNPKLTLRNFEFGNLIHVEHIPTTGPDEGEVPAGKLPDWVGVILPDRTWNDDVVLITAYSAETLLAYRSMPYASISLPAGQAFQQLIAYANNLSTKNTIQINEGTVFSNETSYQDNLVTNAYDHIVKLVQATNMIWRVRGEISPQSYALSLYADLFGEFLYAKSSLPTLTLTGQNTKEKNPLMKEQGTIITDIFAYTHASTAADRKMQEVINQTAFDLYGPFQVNLVFTGVEDVSTLEQMARERFSTISGPKRLFSKVVIDTGDAFNYLRLNNVLRINEPKVGFNPSGGFGVSAFVKIIAMSYDDTANETDLTIEVF